jgi:selenocysteine-specific elongation factor
MTVVIGTAGHIDHGKTTLVRALTGIDADRLPEERRRGMTIDVGYAHLALPDGTELDFVDVPGHDRLVGNMLVGAGEIDAAMLVVAADDGPRAQTIEHLALLDALDVRHGVAVITKADLAGPERTGAVVAAVRDLLGGTGLAGSPIATVSSPDGGGIGELRTMLVALRDRVLDAGVGPGAAQDDAAGHRAATAGGSRLAIDRVFAVKGRGAVVTGTLRGRPVARGTALRLVPGERSVRIREVQVHGAAVEVAELGRTALNVAGVDAAELHRGLVMTDDPAVVASDRLLVRLGAGLPDRARARVHLGTAAVDAIVGRSGRDALDLPDGSAGAILRLAAPLAVAAGDRLVLRRTSGPDRIVGALVLDGAPPRGVSRRRQTSERVARLAAAVAAGHRSAAAAARLDLHGALETDGGAVELAADVADAGAEAVLAAVADAHSAAAAHPASGSGQAPTTASPTIGSPTLAEARAIAATALRRHATLGRAAASAAAVIVVERLVTEGRLVRDGTALRPAGSEVPLRPAADPAFAAAMDRLERALAVSAPPALGDAARAAACPPAAVRELERTGRIVVLEPDLAYATSAYRAIEATAIALASGGPLTPAALRDATGTSRRYVMAILADLDRRGVLRRTPDGHIPGPRVAGPPPAAAGAPRRE